LSSGGEQALQIRDVSVLVTLRSQDADAENTNIDLSQERIRHLHAVRTASPGPSDASVALRGVYLLIRRRYVRWVEHKDVDRVSEATHQWMREGCDERFYRDLLFYGFSALNVVG
jgi:hypothetical protein